MTTNTARDAEYEAMLAEREARRKHNADLTARWNKALKDIAAAGVNLKRNLWRYDAVEKFGQEAVDKGDYAYYGHERDWFVVVNEEEGAVLKESKRLRNGRRREAQYVFFYYGALENGQKINEAFKNNGFETEWDGKQETAVRVNFDNFEA